MPEQQWYALYTAARAEIKVYERLVKEGFETFLPLKKVERQWSDRKKIIDEPVFRSYVFVKTMPHLFYQVTGIPGAVCFVHFEKKPAPIREEQIEMLKKLIKLNASFIVTPNKFKPGQKVKVIEGIFQGLKGEVVSEKHKELFIIRIDTLQYNLVLQIEDCFLAPDKIEG